MITLIWRTDAHLADQAPQSRKDDWRQTVLGKLQQVGELARSAQAAAVLDGGDLFHIKTPSRNAHETVGLMADLQASYPCPTYACVGNHDVKYGDLRFLDESPLGTLFKAGVLHRLYDEHEAWFDDGEGVTVRVVGIPYHGSQYDQNRVSRIVKGRETYLVVVAHLLASQTGGTLFEKEDILSYNDLANHDADVWLFGHWHKNQGVQRLQGGKVIVNIGSLSRGALSEDDVKRTPEAAILYFTKRGVRVEPRALQVEPAEAVFDLEGRTRQESRHLSVEQFVENLKAALVTTEKSSLLEEVQNLPGIPDVVRERAILYLEETAEESV